MSRTSRSAATASISGLIGRVPSRSIRSVSMNDANRSPIFCASALSSVASSVSVAIGGQVLDDRVDLLLGHVGQLHERPPARPVRRDVGLLQPAAVHVAEQVVLRPDVGVHALAGVVQDAHGLDPSSVSRGAN